MAQELYIGLDLGGTRIRAALLNKELEVLKRSETLTEATEGQDAIVKRMVEQAKKVWPNNGANVKAIGISAPGPINPMEGMIVAPPNLPGWHNVPLSQLIADATGITTYLGNDANLAALAETTRGAARGYANVVFLTISTGIGGGIIVNNEMLIGSKGLGAEAGHMVMVFDGKKTSSFEREASGTALARQAKEAVDKSERSIILDMANGSSDSIKGYMVGEAAKAGDKLGLRLMNRAGMIIGLGICNLLHLFNPEIVVLGGGVIEGSWNILYPNMIQAIKDNSLDPDYWRDLKIVPAELGENVSIIGAGALAQYESN